VKQPRELTGLKSPPYPKTNRQTKNKPYQKKEELFSKLIFQDLVAGGAMDGAVWHSTWGMNPVVCPEQHLLLGTGWLGSL